MNLPAPYEIRFCAPLVLSMWLLPLNLSLPPRADATITQPERLDLPPELAEAPIDDEPMTDEEAAAIAEARDSVARGDLITREELRRRLGL